ncbi:hypothetical protein H6P81_011122 [Aristolochia fimbriata]|uniref:Uncharacterized protein n=1 Tax=Aristolochia fimbriata TaxID=158543 RepID=A0AAV7EU43_ARIFI|nr:hypothetical protein H6P81_011122 [Aristolochia fimbriata]
MMKPFTGEDEEGEKVVSFGGVVLKRQIYDAEEVCRKKPRIGDDHTHFPSSASVSISNSISTSGASLFERSSTQVLSFIPLDDDDDEGDSLPYYWMDDFLDGDHEALFCTQPRALFGFPVEAAGDDCSVTGDNFEILRQLKLEAEKKRRKQTISDSTTFGADLCIPMKKEYLIEY